MRKLIATIAGVSVSLSVWAAPVDAGKSSVAITFTQMGVPVEAHFNRFRGDIAYDPKQPEQALATLIVDVASFDLGDPEYNREVQKPEWFNTAKFAEATFKADRVRVVAPGRLEASGVLSVKGHSENVVVPMTVTATGKQQIFEGAFSIKRLGFAIGEGDWADTDMVENDVQIKFSVSTIAE